MNIVRFQRKQLWINLGGKLVEGLAAQQARRYKGLRDDPPDPLFTEFAALDMAQVNAELAADAALYEAKRGGRNRVLQAKAAAGAPAAPGGAREAGRP